MAIIEIQTKFFGRPLYYNMETKVYETEGKVIEPKDERLVKYLQYSMDQYSMPPKMKLMREAMHLIIGEAKKILPKGDPEEHFFNVMRVPVQDPILFYVNGYSFNEHEEGGEIPTVIHRMLVIQFTRRHIYVGCRYGYTIWDVENIESMIPEHWNNIEDRYFEYFIEETKMKNIKRKQNEQERHR